MAAIHLILFSRAPVAGESKTRLAASLGGEAAKAFHVCCLKDLIATFDRFRDGNTEVNCHLFITPPHAEGPFAAEGVHWPEHFQVHPQCGQELGERMANAFAQILGGSSRGSRALLMGADLPLLQEGHLADAVQALQRADVVWGATADGGYYLVGMKQPYPELFALEGWGGSAVLKASLARAAELGLSTECTSALPDVDVFGDLARVRAHPLYRELAGRHATRFIAGLPRVDPQGAAG
ncbi:MAG: TIGR04282 family arsenosugar biosynthesis glycosyltransferase [SAR324 cluster bacterium]|nr:TIGR04282 family arsenosugar biosynthesis glycosyltransferase [SAR324 cluster bacterium]